MAGTFQCDIVTPEKALFSGQIDFIVLPGSAGEMGVYVSHAPTVTTLRPGVVRIKQDGSADATEQFVVNGGYAQIDGKRVTILASLATNLSDIDAAQVKARIAELQKSIDALEEGDDKRVYYETLLGWEHVQQAAIGA